MPGRKRSSVRLNVLDALAYNFPEYPVLYRNNIHRMMIIVRQSGFCIESLGVTYRGAPPPFLKFGNIPPEE